MVSMTSLLLPIVLSAVFVFIVSSVIHMFLNYHRSDWVGVPNEDLARTAIKPLNIPPGDYVIPRAESSKEMNSDEFKAKVNEGPVLFMTILPNGSWGMGKSLVMWFIYSLVVGLFAGYLARAAVGPGGDYLEVFRVAGTAAFMGYALALWQGTIWYKRKLSSTIKSTIDGLIYGLITGGTFGWLWPS